MDYLGSPIYILGAGGHAKVVISTVVAAGSRVVGAYVDDVEEIGSEVLGVPVLGTSNDLEKLGSPQTIIAIGSNRVRQQIGARLPGMTWTRAIHPSAVVHESVQLGEGTVVFAGAILQPDAVIGAHCIINTSASVDHDCIIGDYVHLAPGVHLAGDVSIGEGSFLGIGTCVIPGIRIGRNAVVGAGAVVIRDVPDGATVVGVPAREQV